MEGDRYYSPFPIPNNKGSGRGEGLEKKKTPLAARKAAAVQRKNPKTTFFGFFPFIPARACPQRKRGTAGMKGMR